MSLLRKEYLDLPAYSTERELADRVLDDLAPWFASQREVAGTHCSGRRLRIDAILRPRDPINWRDPEPAFGIEFKAAGVSRWGDSKDFTGWAAQAINYTHVDWDDYGRLLIFTCPSPVRHFDKIEPQHDGINAAFVMSRLLWQLGVGELAPLERDGWTLLGQGNHVLWSQTRGVHEGRTWSLVPKVGSR